MRFRLVLATLLTVALFSTIVYAAGDDDGQVIDNPWAHLFTTTPATTQVTTTVAPTVTTTVAPVETTTSDGYYDVSQYRNITPYTYPQVEGKVFAGWYTDSSCQTKFNSNTGRAFAKFVDEKVLTIKYQTNSNKSYIRFLSTVDSIDYQGVGFVFSGTYGSAEIPLTERESTKVYKSIIADNIAVSAQVFSPDSQYFFTYTLRKLNPEINLNVDFTPYWITHDGTKVMGQSKHYPIH